MAFHAKRGTPAEYRSFYVTIRKMALKAGIRKRVFPHLFRHSRATFLASRMTEAQMKEYFGWTQSSDMAATYVHLSGRDVDDTLLKINHIDRVEKQESTEAENKKAINTMDALFQNPEVREFLSKKAAEMGLGKQVPS